MSQEISSKERVNFALSKVKSSTKWIVLSGTATYFLTGLLDIVAQVELPLWATLILYLIINTLIFGISKYVEGQDTK